MKVGFVGVGSIGAPMAGRLRGAGHEIVVFDSNIENAMKFLEGGGCTLAKSPQDLGDQVSIAFYSLPTPQAVHAVTLGENGIVHGRAVQNIVDLSTTGPATAIEVAAKAKQFGKQFFDAPVSGGPVGAANGTLAVMAAGPKPVFDLVRPLLEVLGKVFFVGEGVGQGHLMKLLNNIVSLTAFAITTEAVVIGVKAGLNPSTMIDVMNVGSGQNSATRDKFPRSVLNRTFNYGFATNLAIKDIRLLRDFARQLGVEQRIGSAAIETFELAEAEFNNKDYTNLVRVLEREADVIVGKGSVDAAA